MAEERKEKEQASKSMNGAVGKAVARKAQNKGGGGEGISNKQNYVELQKLHSH